MRRIERVLNILFFLFLEVDMLENKFKTGLVKELKKGDDCTESYSAEQARAMLGIAE